jgi:hypothetical protein
LCRALDAVLSDLLNTTQEDALGAAIHCSF